MSDRKGSIFIYGVIFAAAIRAEAGAPVASLGTLSLQNSQYVSSGQTYYRDDAGNSNSSISADVDLTRSWRKATAHVLLRDEYSATENWNYLNVYEAQVAIPLRKESLVHIGRHLETWSAWEGEWNQGLFQPRYMQNRLRAESAGLIGAFWTEKRKNVSATVGLLPMNMPEFGPHFYVKDHKFTSENPWFVPPASQFVFRQEISDIRYTLVKPDVTDVIFKPGAVGKLEWTYRKYFGRLSAAYKPMPHFLLGFPSENRVIVGAQEDYMRLEVNPRLAYHRLISVDNMVRYGAWDFSASLTHENPDDEGTPDNWTAQRAAPAWITALGVSRPLEDEGPLAARVRVGFLKVNGGHESDRGEFARETSLFEGRYQYLEAYRLGLSKPWRGIFKFPLETEIAVIYDRMQNGGVFTMNAGLNLRRDLRVVFEADFLGLLGTEAEVQDGFLSTYRANDRIGAGMSYVF